MAARLKVREGSGRICLDYVRTLRHRGSPAEAEELTDPAALTAWLCNSDPGTGSPRQPDIHAVESARTLRAAVFRVVDLARTTKGGVGAAPLVAWWYACRAGSCRRGCGRYRGPVRARWSGRGQHGRVPRSSGWPRRFSDGSLSGADGVHRFRRHTADR
ncbi:ABATE domain-containing protein [Nocardia sp. CA-135953]|uniref:ABATE domain-containing protein n=1 Tax=Nocardia sp. CA-135953 TaxID=3239978 RepID=UPI003D994C47